MIEPNPPSEFIMFQLMWGIKNSNEEPEENIPDENEILEDE